MSEERRPFLALIESGAKTHPLSGENAKSSLLDQEPHRESQTQGGEDDLHLVLGRGCHILLALPKETEAAGEADNHHPCPTSQNRDSHSWADDSLVT
jgi:hypothetical protein